METMLHEKRFLATLIDFGLGIVLSILFGLLFNLLFEIRFMSWDYYYLFMFTITMFLYQFICILFFKDRTLGLHLMSLKLLSNDWEKVNIKQNILRSVSISIPVLFLVNILYMFVYHTKSTTLFDTISDTMVVNTGDNYHVNPEHMIDKIKKYMEDSNK